VPEPLPRRGEVWLVSFDPAIGGEIQKTRPAVVLSNDTANALLNRVQVVPVSSQVGRLYPAEAYITLNGERRKAMADQLATASKLRLIRRLGVCRRRTLAASSAPATCNLPFDRPALGMSVGSERPHFGKRRLVCPRWIRWLR
jgi:mRNA interferase MazF